MTPADVLNSVSRHLELTGFDKAYLNGFMERNRLQLEGRIRARFRPLGEDRIVTLNLGLGRDSFTMLCLLLEGSLLAQQTAVRTQDIAAVVFSDTGYEWQHTYEALSFARSLCQKGGLRFLHLEKPQKEGEAGWQAWTETWTERRAAGLSRALPPWRQDPPASIEARARSGYYHARAPILDDYQSRRTVISMARQDCTSNHKIAAIRRLIEDLAFERFQVESNRDWGREVRRGTRRPHLSLIGYAADEPDRFTHESCSPDYVEEAYPLVELGVRKEDEAPILERWQLGHLLKSGCVLCPYQPIAWYWALREVDPEAWAKVIEYEANALSQNPRMSVIPGGSTLAERVDQWRARNPEATVDTVLSKAYTRCRPATKTETVETLNEPCLMPDLLLRWVMARVQSAGHGGMV